MPHPKSLLIKGCRLANSSYKSNRPIFGIIFIEAKAEGNRLFRRNRNFVCRRCGGKRANLPCIATHDWMQLSSSVRDHEPQSALDSGPSGMELIEELAAQARNVLVPGGMLFLEFGYDQGAAVSQQLNKHKVTKLTENRVAGHFYFKDFEPEQEFKKGSCPTVERHEGSVT